jgi:hypothetical protein
LLAAKELEHRAELGKLRMQLALYRETLEAHGIAPPDRDGDELLQMWRDCSAVISSASEFAAHLSSSKELLSVWTK